MEDWANSINTKKRIKNLQFTIYNLQMKTIKLILITLLILPFSATAQILSETRWNIQIDGSIAWNLDNAGRPHYDHIEMSGLQMSAVLRYGVNQDGSFQLERSMIWPMLRTIPNNTHASLMQRFAIDYPSLLMVNGLTLSNEKVKKIALDGRLTVVSEFAVRNTPTVEITRVFFPSTDKPMLCEKYTVKNITKNKITVIVPLQRLVYNTDPEKGVDGSYTMLASIQQGNSNLRFLDPEQSLTFAATVQAYKEGQTEISADIYAEENARKSLIKELWTKLEFKTSDEMLNTAFAFAKIRASESIYKTKNGLMHGPGGESYYAAIWANDQAEYVNPFFPYLGYAIGNESAFNSFLHFSRFMNPAYKPIPSSIIAEGTDIWNGAGDRGDQAMIAYGAARFALTLADKQKAEELWPLIEWCLEYCKRKLNSDGVVNSDSDELEGRFPAGNANLCTSSLYYDALLSAGYLAKSLKKPNAIAEQYTKEAEKLKTALNTYFGANVEGFETYRYYDGNDILRSWIAIPLTVGIFERKEGTMNALFSPRLWTKDGLLTQAGTETFWDRSTLYALRGVYQAGAREEATQYLKSYSVQRLLGDHVPYPIEAWPEGGQRHLSAESGLYCRIVTEGIFGIRPTGFNSFTLTPQLPLEWTYMELKNIEAFAHQFDIRVERKSDTQIKTIISENNKLVKTFISENGETVNYQLSIDN
jgi:hypothetical protein